MLAYPVNKSPVNFSHSVACCYDGNLVVLHLTFSPEFRGAYARLRLATSARRRTPTRARASARPSVSQPRLLLVHAELSTLEVAQRDDELI